MTKFRVLSTKKLSPACVELAEKNILLTYHEFISVRPIMTKDKWEEVFKCIGSPVTSIVFTSAHAVEAVNKYLHPYLNHFEVIWKIFCLSGKTKDAVEKTYELKGRIADMADNASMLAEKILHHGVKDVIFFCGDQRRDELPRILRDHDVAVQEVIVYQTIDTPAVTGNEFEGVLFFSPSGTRSFFSMNSLKDATICFAIGETTANEIVKFCSNKIIISRYPSQESMMETLNDFIKSPETFSAIR